MLPQYPTTARTDTHTRFSFHSECFFLGAPQLHSFDLPPTRLTRDNRILLSKLYAPHNTRDARARPRSRRGSPNSKIQKTQERFARLGACSLKRALWHLALRPEEVVAHEIPALIEGMLVQRFILRQLPPFPHPRCLLSPRHGVRHCLGLTGLSI